MKKTFYKIYWSVFSVNIAYGYINTFIQIYIASTLSIFFNKAVTGETSSILRKAVNFIIILVLIVIFNYLMDLYMNLKRQKNKEKFKRSIYNGLLSNSFEYIERRTFGEVLTRLDKDLNKVVENLDVNASLIVVDILSFITYFIYIFKINISFAVISLILGVISLAPPYILKNIFYESFEEYNLVEEKIAAFLNETLKGFEFIKLNKAYEYFENKYSKLSNESGVISTKLDKTTSLEKSLKTGIENISKFGMYGVLAFLLYKGSINVGQVVLCVFVGLKFIDSLGSIFEQYHNMQNCNISIRRIGEILGNDDECGAETLQDINNIEFDSVTFSYDGVDNVLKEVNFKIQKGDKILIQGKNGSGKSTLIKLLLGLYSSYEGCIKVNGNNLEDIHKKAYEQQVCYVPQEQFFLGESPLEDLLLFNNDIDKAKKYLAEFNLSVEEMMGKSCDKLSGGQKQKICIIRSLMRNGSLTILDEPTNYLDSDGIEVLKNIIKSSRQTMLVISHDPSLTGAFKNIFKLENGILKHCDLEEAG